MEKLPKSPENTVLEKAKSVLMAAGFAAAIYTLMEWQYDYQCPIEEPHALIDANDPLIKDQVARLHNVSSRNDSANGSAAERSLEILDRMNQKADKILEATKELHQSVKVMSERN